MQTYLNRLLTLFKFNFTPHKEIALQIIKKLVKSIFRSLGIKVIRLNKQKPILPKASVEGIELVAKLGTLAQGKLHLLQIGTCDGFTSDSIVFFILGGNIKAHLVEPAKHNFEMLQQFYSDKPHADVTLINVAVSDKDETKTFYTVKNSGKWKDSGRARELASFYKEHLLRHGIEKEFIQAEDVEGLTLSSIIKRYKITDPDILLIDTEGFDLEVVNMALADGVTPNFIAFEFVQILRIYSQEEINAMYDNLTDNGYVFIHDARNSLAVKKDFLSN